LLDGYDTMKGDIGVSIRGPEGAQYFYGYAKEIQNDEEMWKDEEVLHWEVDIDDGDTELAITVKRETEFELTDDERYVLITALRRMEYLEELCLAEENKAVEIFESCGLPDAVADRIREHIYDVQGRCKTIGTAMQAIETEIYNYNTNL